MTTQKNTTKPIVINTVAESQAIQNNLSGSYALGANHNVGGLYGVNAGTISNSYSTGSVSGVEIVGGLLGNNYTGSINNSYSTGTVSGFTPSITLTPDHPPIVLDSGVIVPDEFFSNAENIENFFLTPTKNRKIVGTSNDDKWLYGGKGIDTITGGAGADHFVFFDIKETGKTTKTRDTITDFKTSEGDKIDLSVIDANTKRVGDQAFVKLQVVEKFNGKFTSTNQLFFESSTHILWGNVDTKSGADFSIQLNGVTELTLSDFIL